MIKRFFLISLALLMFSCGGARKQDDRPVITVSIPPYSYFVEMIAGNDFNINIMVPAGANPHIYEPVPVQISNLRRSEAYISNGYLGFEMTWLGRFSEINKTMIRQSLAENIEPIDPGHHHEGEEGESADPHYWVSPQCALKMAPLVKDLLCRINPAASGKYGSNYDSLVKVISGLDTEARKLFANNQGGSFMIYHPNLAYLARDYGLEEIPVEFEGKEPAPSRLRELIDLAKERKIKTIFVQREYDTRNAREIAAEIGAEIYIIDPLSADWYKATDDIIQALNNSLEKSKI